MAGNDFRVDTDKLKAVADDIADLLEFVKGDRGKYPGSLPHFQEATPDDLQQGVAPLLATHSGGVDDSFTGAYRNEHEAITNTYGKLIEQLTRLHTSTSTTASTYTSSDHDSKQTVNSTSAGTEWGS